MDLQKHSLRTGNISYRPSSILPNVEDILAKEAASKTATAVGLQAQSGEISILINANANAICDIDAAFRQLCEQISPVLQIAPQPALNVESTTVPTAISSSLGERLGSQNHSLRQLLADINQISSLVAL